MRGSDAQNQSTAANRKDLVSDHQKRQVTAKEIARLEKQKKLAQTLRLKEEAEANGEDLERKKAWEWSIEQDERWSKKMEEREERSDNRYHSMSLCFRSLVACDGLRWSWGIVGRGETPGF